jgi:hypothetical protein
LTNPNDTHKHINTQRKNIFALAAIAWTSFSLDVSAKEIPARLPDPDNKPPATDKPVEVYILSGQSNMVGMGDINGGSSRWGKEVLDPVVSSYPGHPFLASHGRCWPSDRTASPEPQGNGCIERFFRTLKENLLWVRTFRTVEELRMTLLEFKNTYNEQWIMERVDYRTPAQDREDACQPQEAVA